MSRKTKTTIVEKEETMGHDDENSTGAKIAVLRNEVKHVGDSVVRMESKMDQFIASGVTQSQLSAAQALADQQHKEINTEINELKAQIDDVRSDVEAIVTWKNNLISKIAGYALLIFVGMVLALYGLNKFL